MVQKDTWAECGSCARRGRRTVLILVEGIRVIEHSKHRLPVRVYFCPFEQKEIHERASGDWICPACSSEFSSDKTSIPTCMHRGDYANVDPTLKNGVKGGPCNTKMEPLRNIVYMQREYEVNEAPVD